MLTTESVLETGNETIFQPTSKHEVVFNSKEFYSVCYAITPTFMNRIRWLLFVGMCLVFPFKFKENMSSLIVENKGLTVLYNIFVLFFPNTINKLKKGEDSSSIWLHLLSVNGL